MLDWEWFTEPETLQLFVYLLLSAAHEATKWRGITVESGECVTTLEEMAQNTHLSVRQVRTSMNRLKTTGEVTSKSTNKYTIVTITNYALYQDEDEVERQAERQADRQTSDKQTTNKPKKKEERKKEDKKESINKENLQECKEDIPLSFIPLKPQVFSMKKQLIADGLDEDLVDAYMKVRKSKKAPDSNIAYKGLKREADKAGISMETAITECVERNWVGFKAEWYDRVKPQPTLFSLQPERKKVEAEVAEINRRTRAEREERERQETEAIKASNKQKILDSIYKN